MRAKLSIPILESKRGGQQERMHERVQNYKSFVDNKRKLGQEAFGNEALERERPRMKGSGWREPEIRMPN